MRLIDALELENLIAKQAGDCKIRLFDPSVNLILQDIRNAPTIGAASAKHGHWIEITPRHTQCSCCEVTCLIAVYPISAHANYCPNCGAKMDGGESE